jgi:hypothetical protein
MRNCIRRHCERSKAIHASTQRKNGLLRFARNDGGGFFEIGTPVSQHKPESNEFSLRSANHKPAFAGL